MRELNEDIDNLFREIIEPAEMRPNQMVWTAIENNLEKTQNLKLQKRLKHLLTYSIASSVIILTLIPILYFNSHQTKTEISQNKIIANALISNQINLSSVISNSPENSTVAIKSSSVHLNNNEKVENVTIADNGNKTQNAESVKSKQSAPIVKEPESKIINTISVNNKIKPKEEVPLTTIITPDPKNHQEQDVKSLTEDNSGSSVVTVEKANVEPTKQNPLLDESLNSSIPTQEIIKENEQNNVVLKPDSINDLTKSEVSPLTRTKVDTAKSTTPLLPIEEYKFYVGGIYSPEKTMTNLVNVNVNNSTLNETQNSSFSSGVRFGYKFSNHWSLCSNIVYSRTSKSFSYYQSTIEQGDDDHFSNINKELATSYGVIDFPSNYIEKHPTGGQNPHHEGDTLIIDVKGLQKLTYLTIPITCQYQITKKRISGIFSIGLSSSILLSQSAEISYVNSDTKYTTKINGIQSLYFNGIIGIGFQYRIFNRFSIFFQPTFSQAFTSMNKNTPYKTYPSSFSGSTGINFHF